MDSTLYGFLVMREDYNTGLRARMRSGTQVVRSGASMALFAAWVAEESRVAHAHYAGPLRVHVWPHALGTTLPRASVELPDGAETHDYEAGLPVPVETPDSFQEWLEQHKRPEEGQGPACWGLM